MKSLIVSQKSWHVFLARFGGLDTDIAVTDICRYTRRCIIGLLLVLLITAVFCIALIPIVVCILHFAFNRIFSEFLDQASIIACIMYGLFIVGGGIFVGCEYLNGKFKEKARQARYKAINDGTYVEPEPKKKKVKQPGFIKLAYKSWKQKYCIKIVIKP